MVIDRLAEFSIDARAATEPNTPALQRRSRHHRLTEIALAYSDLCFEIAAGTRRLPDFLFPAGGFSTRASDAAGS